MTDDSAPMPSSPLSDRELLIAQCVVSFARAAMIQSDLTFLEKEAEIQKTKEAREAVEEKRNSRNMALITLWRTLMPLIDGDKEFWEKIK